MTFARPLALLLALSPLAASAHDTTVNVDGCKIEKGPDDLVSTDGPLVVRENQRAEDVIALRGDVVLKRGATVAKAVALAGSVRVEAGATVRQDAVAIGGDVRVARGGRVGNDAVAIGGRLQVDEGAEVAGDRVALDLALGGFDLRKSILAELKLEGCVVEPAGK